MCLSLFERPGKPVRAERGHLGVPRLATSATRTLGRRPCLRHELLAHGSGPHLSPLADGAAMGHQAGDSDARSARASCAVPAAKSSRGGAAGAGLIVVGPRRPRPARSPPRMIRGASRGVVVAEAVLTGVGRSASACWRSGFRVLDRLRTAATTQRSLRGDRI